MDSSTRILFLIAIVMIVSVSSFLLNGSLGFMTKSLCNEPIKDLDGENRLRTADEQMECLRIAAISEAMKNHEVKANELCDEIYNNAVSSKDYKLKANMCYTEIAKILVDDTICDKIEDTGIIFSGNKATREACKTQVGHIYNALNNQQKICTVVFVIPILFVATVLLTERRKKKN